MVMSSNKMEIVCMLCRRNEWGFTYGALHSEVDDANLALMLAHALV